MKPSILFLLLILGFLVISCQKEDNEKRPLGNLEVIVTNEFGQAIAGAKVEFDQLSAFTGLDGKFTCNLPAKNYIVSASMESFLTAVKQVTISENDTAILNFVLMAGNVYLKLSDSVLYSKPDHSIFQLQVSSNAGWLLENHSNWITCTKSGGQGNEIVEIDIPNNPGDSSRTDSILVVSGSVKKKLIVHQSVAIRLLQCKGKTGNILKGVKDSVLLLFNKPVNIKIIKSTYEYCFDPTPIHYSRNNCAITFDYSCAELGGEYPFTIEVTDNESNSLRKDIMVPFYSARKRMDGYISDFVLINNDKELLVSAFAPNRIFRYSIEDDSILQSYDLSSIISPLKISYNPYDSKLYIMGADPDAAFSEYTTFNKPDVYTLDPVTGEINLAFTVQPDQFDHPQSPAIIPYQLAFTGSGLGIILLKANGSDALRWKLIDCAKNDSIYNYPGYTGTVDDYYWFNSVHSNFDYTKIFMTKPYSSCQYGIFDASSRQVSLLSPSSSTAGFKITASRKSDRFYARQLYDQFIIDLNGNISSITYLDSRHNGNADFCYETGHDNLIFLCEQISFDVPPEPNQFYILDYNDGNILKSCDLLDGFLDFSTTIDGQYAVASKVNFDYSSSIYVFSKNDLWGSDR
jgi:hypothetical protein